MRVTIIGEDHRVNVEGQSEYVDLSTLDEDISVVQWYGASGEVEYKNDFIANTRKPNERITDFAPYQKFVDLWMTEAQKLVPTTVVPVPEVVVVPNAA
jgi:hypothetical protein